ncbi:YybH family protein [Rhizobium binxianense]
MTDGNTNPNAEERAIAAMLQRRAEALGGKKAAEALSHETDDVVHFSLAPPLGSTGKDEAGLQAWFDTWDGPIGREVREGKLAIGGDVAFWSGLMHMTGTKTGGEKVDLWFRLTLCLVKKDGRWKVAHEHESVPFAMDGSDRALLDLRP